MEIPGCDEQGWEFIRQNAPTLSKRFACPECLERIEEVRRAEVEIMAELDAQDESDRLAESRTQKWESMCPGEFRVFDSKKYPSRSQSALAKVLGWDLLQKGLILHGPTGSGKTVAAWAAIKPYVLHSGIRVEAYTANQFAVDAAKFAQESADKADRWLRKLRETAILFVDDLGKRKMSDHSEAQLFDVIDYRYANRKVMIFTCEGSADWLGAFLGESRRDGMIRRIKESCESVSFI